MVGVGVDLVEVDRLREVIDRRPRLVERVFTEDERAYASRFSDPWPRLAARFAAKEAALKAIGVGLGGMSMLEIEVRRETGGAPLLCVTGQSADVAARKGVAAWHCSLTHTASHAQAVVMALG
ncbi:MAG: holo-ACP synthase [Actinomycetota bacterium]|nr:holo-ACP synthase [Actinomycetota bacterium]